MAGSDSFRSLAVVTGGGSGIGQSVCCVFAREGFSVVVADINTEAAENTLRQLKGTDHCTIPVNVAERQSVTSLFSTIKGRYRRSPDVVVNCAGVHQPNLLLEITDDDFDSQINVNLKGTFLMTQEACRHMVDENMNEGSIINISSTAASNGHPNHAVYSASKGGVESFTRAVAVVMAPHGIRVNVISPGVVETPMVQKFCREHPEEGQALIDMIPGRKMAKPEEIAAVCAFLASCKSSYMTGAVVPVTAGYRL